MDNPEYPELSTLYIQRRVINQKGGRVSWTSRLCSMYNLK